MSVSRIVEALDSIPSARARQLRRARRLALEPLENRTALAAGPDLSASGAGRNRFSFGVSFGFSHLGHDARSSRQVAREQTDTGDADQPRSEQPARRTRGQAIPSTRPRRDRSSRRAGWACCSGAVHADSVFAGGGV